MNRKKKIGLGMVGFIALSAITYASFTAYKYANNDAICNGKTCKGNDTWIFDVSNIEIYNREKATAGHMGNITGKITSTLFGNFDGVDLKLENTSSDSCGKYQKTYKVSGKIRSIYFGEMSVKSDSIYCPGKELEKNMKLSFISNLLGTKYVASDLTGAKSIDIFDKQQVAIIGASKVDGNINKLETNDENVEINTLEVAGLDKGRIWENINKNIANLTRNLSPRKEKTLELNGVHITGGKYFYYNYEGEDGSDNRYGNSGENLKIGNNSFSESKPEDYKVDFDGDSTVIVKGGNVYINADIINSKGITTIIAKRDGNNGGNIYVDPDVTNIDAVLIADGSLLSYREGSGILNRNDGNLSGKLSRQLYIYGSIFTKNVIASKKVPYGSDRYLQGLGEFPSANENDFDLANMRQFQAMYSLEGNNVGNSTCRTGTGANYKRYIVPGYSNKENLTSVKTYAWAGKSKCFNEKLETISGYNNDKEVVDGLRGIGRKESVIIEYNPRIQLNMPYVLKNNK